VCRACVCVCRAYVCRVCRPCIGGARAAASFRARARSISLSHTHTRNYTLSCALASDPACAHVRAPSHTPLLSRSHARARSCFRPLTHSLALSLLHALLSRSYGVSAKEPYKRDDILQKRPIISRSLLIVATPYVIRSERKRENKRYAGHLHIWGGYD